MHVIKKYANRKLYHTNRKQYITLEGIARLVQQGDAVQILDNETGEDITSSILAQVVLQARGKNTSQAQLPASLLTGLIQVGGDTLSNVRKTLFSNFGGGDLVENAIVHRIERCLAEGIISQAEANRMRQVLLHRPKSDGSSELSDSDGSEPVLPSRGDLERLNQQVDALSAMVEQLLNEQQRKRAD